MLQPSTASEDVGEGEASLNDGDAQMRPLI